jgi:hypothetical protein
VERPRILFALGILALSVPALSQEATPQEGQLDFDFKPTAGVGFGFQISERFSVRPLFGGFRPAETGNQLTLGVDLRYDLTRRSSLAPYLLGNVTYGRNYLVENDDGANEPVPRIGTFGLGLGLRQPIGGKWAVFGELSFQHSTADGTNGGWNEIPLGNRDAMRFDFGITLNLKK